MQWPPLSTVQRQQSWLTGYWKKWSLDSCTTAIFLLWTTATMPCPICMQCYLVWQPETWGVAYQWLCMHVFKNAVNNSITTIHTVSSIVDFTSLRKQWKFGWECGTSVLCLMATQTRGNWNSWLEEEQWQSHATEIDSNFGNHSATIPGQETGNYLDSYSIMIIGVFRLSLKCQ